MGARIGELAPPHDAWIAADACDAALVDAVHACRFYRRTAATDAKLDVRAWAATKATETAQRAGALKRAARDLRRDGVG